MTTDYKIVTYHDDVMVFIEGKLVATFDSIYDACEFITSYHSQEAA